MNLVPPSDPSLWRVAQPVTDLADPSLGALISELKRLMIAHRGVGLSAPQLGVSLRVFVFRAGYPLNTYTAINPEVVSRSPHQVLDREGCLTWPMRYATVPRSREVRVRFHDEEGIVRDMNLKARDARVFLHELDHLEGICLFARPREMDTPLNAQSA